MGELMTRRREMIKAGENGPQPILLFEKVLASAVGSFYTDYFNSAKLTQLAEAETITIIVWPVLVSGDDAVQNIRPRINNSGVRTNDFCYGGANTLFSETADQSTYAKFIRPVKSEWATTSCHKRLEYIDSSGEQVISNGTFTLGTNAKFSQFTTKFRFLLDNATHFGIGTRCEVWLDLDPLWL